MLVKFLSSVTGELIMFAEAAGPLLRILDKECSARGVFTLEEMMPAATRLREAVARGQSATSDDDAEDGLDKPVAMGPRAWPLIDMLERTSKGGKRANIVWEAAAPF